MFTRVLLLLFCVLLLPSVYLTGQTYPITDGGTVNACSGIFTDGGGSSADHGPAGTVEIITFCSDDDDDQTHVQLDFREIALSGIITIFDGADTSADTLRQLTSSFNGDQVFVTASDYNASGCLTVEFRSSGTASGWEADLNCATACQPILAEVTPTVDGFIDVCVGEPITLTGRGSYPQNGRAYEQSDANSTFVWDFQNGEQREGQTVTYAYGEPGGYTVNLSITDQNGCESSNQVGLRVRVAPPPIFAPAGPPLEPICPGENVTLSIAGDGQVADPRPSPVSFQRSETFSETLAIPDELGRIYSSALNIELFGEDERITAPTAIEEICVTMEHSFLGDLDMWVECPNGQRLQLLDVEQNLTYPSNVRMGLGTSSDPTPEPPLTYCWSADAAETVYQVATTQPSTGQDRPILPDDRKYLPLDGDFGALTGCLLDGAWTLNAVDNFPEDEGTVYNWTITFSNEVLPARSDFTIPLVDTRWYDSGQLETHGNGTVVYRGGDPGFYQQRLEVEDSLGCVYDTLYRVDIRSPYAADCFTCPAGETVTVIDTTVCEGDELRPGIEAPIDTAASVTWRAYEDRAYAQQLTSELVVTHHTPDNLADPAETLRQVCVDVSAVGGLAETEIGLRAPNGTYVVLAARGTLSGTSLTRCFSGDDVAGWSSLAGTLINGGWSLVVDDGSESGGRLTEWSMELMRKPEITYSWLPVSPDFSCTDCLDPLIRPTASGTYTLYASSSDGCTDSTRLEIEVVDSDYDFTATVSGGCAGANNGFIDLEPTAPLVAATYRWSNGAATQDISDLAPGTYELTVTAAGSCSRTFSYTLPDPVALTFAIENIVGVSCSGAPDGQIFTSVAGGTPPYSYVWSDPALTGATAGAVSAGSYTVTVTDSVGCSASVVAEVPAATELELSIGITDVSCAGASDGGVTVSVAGGNGPAEIRWEGFPDGAQLSSLPAGRYPFSVVDGSGCTLRDTAIIGTPEFLSIVADTTAADCAGSDLGTIRLAVAGGTSPYQYSWADGNTSAAREDLPAGTYAVTVTDANGCTTAESYNLAGSDPLEVTATATAPVCGDEATGSLELTGSGGVGPYLYSLDGEAFVSSQVFENLDDRDYLVFVKDAAGCVVTREIAVPAPPEFSVTLGPDITLTYGDSVQLSPQVIGGSGDLLYAWTTTDPTVLDCRSCPSPTASPEYEAGVSLVVSDTQGCTAEDVFRIRVRKIREVAIPTGFSPNGDGNNDRLIVHGRPGTRVVDYMVFDRWGGKLYEATDFFVNEESAGWDGTDHTGRPQNTGVYLYKVTVEFEDGSRETRSGQTTLIR